MEDKIVVISVRVIDMANPAPGTWTIPCDECEELTWISGLWKDRKFDGVVCEPCWFKNYKNREHVACTSEEILQLSLKTLGDRGVNVTKEELIKMLEFKIGKEIKIT